MKKIKIFRKKLDLLRHQGDNSNLQFCEASPSDNSASLENWWWHWHLATMSGFSLPNLVWFLTNTGHKVLSLCNINQMWNSKVATLDYITREQFFSESKNTKKTRQNSKAIQNDWPQKVKTSCIFCYLFCCVFFCANSNFFHSYLTSCYSSHQNTFESLHILAKKNLLLLYI